ncbi:MerR family transcriptional regulator [Marinobacterium arenosum]|uniref:MerR family transcriptional regulator n=1 Tax=Marinobacterium arenosum TaxID=2862496 RepID=UPI001C939EAA|nr:MerR family transcriptional regulator [Marinobacterium arenosum]MBY4676507.1 MerR family transcriptional regulator [Marinobacterium arenosum]
MSLTISQLARRFGISRSTLLYYEREGLLSPARTAANGYRHYGPEQCSRLEQILSFRALEVPVAEIGQLLQADEGDQARILHQQFDRLGQEIQRLQRQQRTILRFLQQHQDQEENMVSKERWTEIMRAAGLTDEDMRNWHRQFEKLEPEAHDEFLHSLGIEDDEVARIRQWSRSAE